MDPEYDILLVGSGPSGVQAAMEAVLAGRKVALLDVGYTRPEGAQAIPSKSFSEIRCADPLQEKYFLGDDPEAVLRNQDRAGAHLTPARQHMIREMETLFPLESDTFLPLQSTGLGGLGISWGANCFALEDFELNRIGIPPAELQPFYRSVALEVGVSGRTDDCTAPRIANMDHSAIQPPLPIDTNAETILEKYNKKKDMFNRQGLFLGQSMLAMLSKDLGDRSANPLHDMDYWTDASKSVFRPEYTLEKLKTYSNFTHLTGYLAIRFQEIDGGVMVHARVIASNTMLQISTRKLLLAAGALNTGRLVLNSFADCRSKLPILCNRNHWVAAVNLSMLGRTARDERHSLSQLTALMECDLNGPDYVLAQIYSYRSLLWFRILKTVPLPPRLGILFLRLIATAFTCINIHYSDVPSEDRWLQLKQSGDHPVLTAHTVFSERENKWLIRNERRLLRFFVKLRCIPIGISRPAFGASIHYAGTLPYSEEEKAFTTRADGTLRGTRNVYIADGSSWRFLPAKGLTLTLMANARRIVAQALASLAQEKLPMAQTQEMR